MDTREALKKGFILQFHNKDNSRSTYLIQNEIGRGAASIVYDASYLDNAGNQKTVRIKECYPAQLEIMREESGILVAAESYQLAFAESKRRMQDSYKLCSELFHTNHLTNAISNTINIYSANQTIYIVSTYQQGTVLSCDARRSLKDSIGIVKSVAKAIAKIHEKGYLYLDAKPENVFTFTETTEMIQLFDFDTLAAMDENGGIGGMASYYNYGTKGYAPMEQQMGKWSRVGTYSDVYSVGALLFYLIFGRVPEAPDCERNAKYDYNTSLYAGNCYQDTLFPEISDFFQNTLANYYRDRYFDMIPLVEQLQLLETYADTREPFIISAKVSRPQLVLGREPELLSISKWISKEHANALFLTGMGGIGKSTLIREYIALNREQFDHVLYLNYTGSMQRTIADDEQLQINTIKKRNEESIEDYFTRKIRAVRELIKGKKVLLVIDQFEGEMDADFNTVLKVDWKVILVTRNRCSKLEFDTLYLKAIQKREHLYALLEACIERKIVDNERVYVDNIIDKVQGHTLIMQLIGKQIACSYLSIRQASNLLDEHGFAHIAPEKVVYQNDQVLSYKTIADIIGALFETHQISLQKKMILKMLSLFSVPGVEVPLFTDLLKLEVKDDINELVYSGLINREEKRIYLHPVMQEHVCQWEWTKPYQNSVLQMVKKLTEYKDESYFISIAERIIDNCQNVTCLHSSGIYITFVYHTLMTMSRDREEYVLKYADIVCKAPFGISEIERMKLYDLVVFIYVSRGDYENAELRLKEAKQFLRDHPNHYTYAQHYDMLAQMYDAKLDGRYQEANANKDYRHLLYAINHAIHHMQQAVEKDHMRFLAEYMLSKAQILIRSVPQEKQEIKKLLHSVKNIIHKELHKTVQIPRFQSEYKLSIAWYYTLVEPQMEYAQKYAKAACKIGKAAYNSKLDYIDYCIIPYANILLEWGAYEDASIWITKAIQICEEQEGVMPYIRKKKELYKCMKDIYSIL